MSRFIVYIIESPSSKDVYAGRGEGDLIRRGLALAGVACELRTVLDKDRFREAILEGLGKLIADKQLTPILHFSAHGDDKGIQLTDGKLIEWSWLGNVLGIINEKANGSLVVSMSSCKGFSCAKMALSTSKTPWKALIGHESNVSWDDVLVGFMAFYHLLNNGKTISEAVEGMKAASGNPGFKIADGAKSKELGEKLKKLSATQFKNVMEALAKLQNQQ